MPKKTCAFGFNCGAMLQTPGLAAEDCPNRNTCGILTALTPEEEVELVRVHQLRCERFRVTQRQAAALMLKSRGCPQTPESLGVTAALSQVESQLSQLRARLSQLEGNYIAPTDCELHHYNVKRPSGTYEYNKLTASTPIFEPSERREKVRVIHLSHDDDARNLEAREGVKHRNKLLSLNTRLVQIEKELESVLAEL